MYQNLYGPNDNFSTIDGHVIPALIKKVHDAVGRPLLVEGNGTAKRQFLYVDDFARALMFILDNYSGPPLIIAPDDEHTIDHISNLIIKSYSKLQQQNVSHISYVNSSSNGQHRKMALNYKFKKLVPNFEFTSLESGIDATVKWYIDNHQTCRK